MVLAGMIGFAGAALAIVGDQKVQFESQALVGYTLAFVAALIWSVYSLLLKRLPPFPNATTGAFNLGAGVIALIVGFITEPLPAFQPNDWIYIFIDRWARWGWHFSFGTRQPKICASGKLGVLSFLTPVLSTGSLLIVTGEQPEVTLYVGAGFVVFAIFSAVWSPPSPILPPGTFWGKGDKAPLSRLGEGTRGWGA